MTFTVGETLPGGGVVTSVSADVIGVRYEGVEFSFDRRQFEQGIAYVLELLKLGAA